MALMRAKMRIREVVLYEGHEQLSMSAVVKSTSYDESGMDENNTYALFTPQADLSMTINNPALFGKFKPGQELYVDFTVAE